MSAGAQMQSLGPAQVQQLPLARERSGWLSADDLNQLKLSTTDRSLAERIRDEVDQKTFTVGSGIDWPSNVGMMETALLEFRAARERMNSDYDDVLNGLETKLAVARGAKDTSIRSNEARDQEVFGDTVDGRPRPRSRTRPSTSDREAKLRAFRNESLDGGSEHEDMRDTLSTINSSIATLKASELKLAQQAEGLLRIGSGTSQPECDRPDGGRAAYSSQSSPPPSYIQWQQTAELADVQAQLAAAAAGDDGRARAATRAPETTVAAYPRLHDTTADTLMFREMLAHERKIRRRCEAALTDYANLCTRMALYDDAEGMKARYLRLLSAPPSGNDDKRPTVPKWQVSGYLPEWINGFGEPVIYGKRIYLSLAVAGVWKPYSLPVDDLDARNLFELNSPPRIGRSDSCINAWIVHGSSLYCLVHPNDPTDDYPRLYRYWNGLYHYLCELPERVHAYCAGVNGSQLFVVGGRYYSASGMSGVSSSVHALSLRDDDLTGRFASREPVWDRWPNTPKPGACGILLPAEPVFHLLGRWEDDGGATPRTSKSSSLAVEPSRTRKTAAGSHIRAAAESSWMNSSIPTVPATMFAAVQVNGSMITCGGMQTRRPNGRDTVQQVTGNCNVLVKGYWRPLPPLREPRYYARVLLYKNTLICIGGWRKSKDFVRQIETLEL
ncbi:uncharacterized protein LOC135819537 [Sycon ciliatum]|uniref:uncharacterized protein LOC135819537 n=1 Tax=Sycon ciliatum TaxID=27933 RepID=UPI0031F637CD